MNPKRRGASALSFRFCFAAVALVLASAAPGAEFRVWTPRLGAPAFVEPGNAITVEVDRPADRDAKTWTATLHNDLREWNAQVLSATPARVGPNSRPGWRLTVLLPSELPPELMDLEIHDGRARATAARAVSIIRRLESDFYVLHLTDEHVRYDQADTKEPETGFRSAELVTWATPVVNLINPRFVVNSGDVSYQYESNGKAAASANLLERYAAAKAGYRVASIIVPGNHDTSRSGTPTHDEATARWEATVGPREFTLRVGSLFVLGHDFQDEALRARAAADYAASAGDPTVRGRLIVQHFADYLRGDAGDAFAFKPGAGVPAPTLMLIGHVHVTRVEQASPFPVLMTVAAHRNARAGFLEFTRDASGRWLCPSAADWSPETSAFALVGARGKPMVEAVYEAPNDGTSATNAVSIRNDLPQRFRDGRVRFIMPAGRYVVAGGVALAQYPFQNRVGVPCTAVLVQVDLLAKATTRVEIRPAPPHP